MVKQRLLSMLALCACVLAFCVIGLGAFTRLVDAGLGCPDWPGCYGHITAPLSESAQKLAILQYPGTHLTLYKAWAEMIHRYAVGALSTFILIIISIIFFKKEYRKLSNIILAILLICLLAYQIILGQLTVTLKLLPIIVTQHLLGGFLILSMLWIIYINNRIGVDNNKKPLYNLLPWAGVGLIILLLQILLGAWTSTNYASLSCPDFPFCVNEQPISVLHFKEAFNFFLPAGINYDGGIFAEPIRQTIQMTHRLGALLFTIYMLGFLAISMRQLRQYPDLMNSLYLILGLLCIQLCLGITNVMFKLPLITAMSHTLIAVLILLSIITFIYKLASFCPRGNV